MTTIRLPVLRAALAAVLVALVVAGIGEAPVRAASSVAIDARVLLGGRYESGGWAAVAVTLVNESAPTDGYLTAETDAGIVRRYVEMPAGARKVVTLYVRPGGFQRQLTVRYEEPNGIVEAAADVRVLDVSGHQVAVVGDADGMLRPQLAGGPIQGAPDPLSLTIADLPERPEPLGGLSVVVWAGDAGALTDGQRRSLERWVADGGQLVVIGGADWQARTAGLEHLLPVEELAAVDAVDHGPLAAWAGSDEALEPDTIATGTLRPDARALVTSADGAPMAAWQSVGSGRVVLFGTDLALDAYRAWAGAPLLWSRVLDGGWLLSEFFGGGFPDREAATSSMAQALNTLPSLDVPPAELLLALIVAYILLIGPISYLVLRRIDRRELAWVTAPLLVIVFTASSYGIGIALKGTDVIVNQIAVLRSTSGGSLAGVEAYAGVYSPTRGTYDVIVEADALVAPMRTDQFFAGQGSAARMTADQGEPARLHDLLVAARGFEYVRADAVVAHESPLEVTWSSEDGDLVGTVTNVGSEPLSDVAFISNGGGEMIGDLAPGATGEFRISSSGLSQSSASDQVYGFGGFNTSDPERRRIAARRGVIDALVGYGGWAPIGSELSGYGGRGPYLIGWRSGEGPMPIALDGVETQRFAELVEVVAIRPGIGSGEVVVGPGQMSIAVATDGGAALIDTATVALGGEEGANAVFSITLPLEASEMEVTAIELIAGTDPGMAIMDGGVFPGMWPPGYSIEVRDARSGEWQVVGDLSAGNRFEIEDPSGAISAAGRIEVRVTAGAPNPDFGDPSVFITARVEGVIAP
ncbi:MAG TPA: hypothetical protein VLA59_08405 [Patescibacteria group bacterium]|nr:hypothetical protein [Patescibacteria group bacterium]